MQKSFRRKVFNIPEYISPLDILEGKNDIFGRRKLLRNHFVAKMFLWRMGVGCKSCMPTYSRGNAFILML